MDLNNKNIPKIVNTVVKKVGRNASVMISVIQYDRTGRITKKA